MYTSLSLSLPSDNIQKKNLNVHSIVLEFVVKQQFLGPGLKSISNIR